LPPRRTVGCKHGTSAKEAIVNENSDSAGYGDRDAPPVGFWVGLGRRHSLLAAPTWHPVRDHGITSNAEADVGYWMILLASVGLGVVLLKAVLVFAALRRGAGAPTK
jgi:hypothetical protein